jgi:hypothetical protein
VQFAVFLRFCECFLSLKSITYFLILSFCQATHSSTVKPDEQNLGEFVKIYLPNNSSSSFKPVTASFFRKNSNDYPIISIDREIFCVCHYKDSDQKFTSCLILFYPDEKGQSKQLQSIKKIELNKKLIEEKPYVALAAVLSFVSMKKYSLENIDDLVKRFGFKNEMDFSIFLGDKIFSEFFTSKMSEVCELIDSKFPFPELVHKNIRDFLICPEDQLKELISFFVRMTEAKGEVLNILEFLIDLKLSFIRKSSLQSCLEKMENDKKFYAKIKARLYPKLSVETTQKALSEKIKFSVTDDMGKPIEKRPNLLYITAAMKFSNNVLNFLRKTILAKLFMAKLD